MTVEGGWMILNYVKYRDYMDKEEQREKNRERVRRFREKQAKLRDERNANCNDVTDTETKSNVCNPTRPTPAPDHNQTNMDHAGNGGLAGSLKSGLVGLVRDGNQVFNNQHALAEVGINGKVRQELSERNDITPALIRSTAQAVQKQGGVDNPTAVIIHRLRNTSKRRVNHDRGIAVREDE